jgi:hypothetical protein
MRKLQHILFFFLLLSASNSYSVALISYDADLCITPSKIAIQKSDYNSFNDNHEILFIEDNDIDLDEESFETNNYKQNNSNDFILKSFSKYSFFKKSTFNSFASINFNRLKNNSSPIIWQSSPIYISFRVLRI